MKLVLGQEFHLAEAAGLVAAQGPGIVGVGVQDDGGGALLLGEAAQHQRKEPPAYLFAPQRRLPDKLVYAKKELPRLIGVVVLLAQLGVQLVDLDVAHRCALKLHQAAAGALLGGVEVLLDFLRCVGHVPAAVKRQHLGVSHPGEKQGCVLGAEGPHRHRALPQGERFHRPASLLDFCVQYSTAGFPAQGAAGETKLCKKTSFLLKYWRNGRKQVRFPFYSCICKKEAYNSTLE